MNVFSSSVLKIRMKSRERITTELGEQFSAFYSITRQTLPHKRQGKPWT